MYLGVIGHVSDRRERAAGEIRRRDGEMLFNRALEVSTRTGNGDSCLACVDIVRVGNGVIRVKCQFRSVERYGNFRLISSPGIANGAINVADGRAGDVRLGNLEGLCDCAGVVARAGDGNGIAAWLSAGQAGDGVVRVFGQLFAADGDGHGLSQFIAGVDEILTKGDILFCEFAGNDLKFLLSSVDGVSILAGCSHFVLANGERLVRDLIAVLVEELERDVACTCRFGLADAGGNSIAVGDGSRNVDLERIRVGVLVNDLDGERTGRLVIIRRREFQCSRVRRVISSICLIRISQHKRDRTHVIAW